MASREMHSFATASKTLILIGVLLSTLEVTITLSHPLSYNTYDAKELSSDHPQLLLLLDHRMPELENEMFDTNNNPGSTVIRTKRIGSLSIVNSLDVLRQRVLLEMARRKALQDQKQIDANRRFLESIGKRSLPEYTGDLSKSMDTRTRNGLDYTIQQQEKNRDRTVTPERILGRIQDWFQADDPAFREEQTRRIGKSSAEADSIDLRWLPWHSTF